jgi:hypothetical protein
LVPLRRSFPTLFLLIDWIGRSRDRRWPAALRTLARVALPPLLLIDWIGRSRGRRWAVALLALATVTVPPLWWAMQLIGLPDIGDPFDVATFRALTIPDDRNAYRLYEQAAARLKPWDLDRKRVGNAGADFMAPWSRTLPEIREWAEANRDALALYRRASELPDALGPPPQFENSHEELWDLYLPMTFFEALALLEGSRQEEVGDMAGAWDWYRALLRAAHHVGKHGTVFRRSVAQDWHHRLRARLKEWAADPRTTPELLRRAIDDVGACESLAPSEPYTLKAEYLHLDRLLDDPHSPTRRAPRSWAYPFTGFGVRLSWEQAQSLFGMWRSWLREPERSRRVIGLAIANWLAYYELPFADRPPREASADARVDRFYPHGPRTKADPRALSPSALSRWLSSTNDANVLFARWGLTKVRSDERSNHRTLLILLGQELYRRDHGGQHPPTPDVLVGSYLKSLPAEFQWPRDETIPVSGK